MAAGPAEGAPKGKVVVKNIGLLVTGDMNAPLSDADTWVSVDGVISAVGKARTWTRTSRSGRRCKGNDAHFRA